MSSSDAIEIHPAASAQNSNIDLLKKDSFDNQSDQHLHPVSSEQHGLMISNNLVSEENNDEEEFENEKTNAKHRKTTIADAIDATDQGDKKKTKVKMVKKKKKSKKAKNAGNNLLSPVSDQN